MDELAINGGTITLHVEGQDTGPALILSHMLGTDLTLWDDLVPAFAEHFRVVRYDTRGHGGSGLGEGSVSLERLGRDVLAIMDGLGIEKAHFCGVSMGGAVGLWLLAHAPARIERAVIAGAAAKLGTPETWNARIGAGLAEGPEQAVAPTIERWFSPRFVDEAPDAVEAVRAMIRATPTEGYAACCAALRDMDLREAVRAVAHPVLVVRGAGDPSVSAEDAAYLAEVMPGATALELDARHCCPIEAKAAFAAAVVKFLLAKTTSRRAAVRRTAGKAPTPSASAKPVARRVGGRGLVAARRPVVKTSPVPGKAVAKASASRKAAARTVSRMPEPASARRRGAAKPVPAEATAKADRSKAPTKTAARRSSSQATPTKAPVRGRTASMTTRAPASPARRAAAPTRPSAAKPRTAAALRAAAMKKVAPKGAPTKRPSSMSKSAPKSVKPKASRSTATTGTSSAAKTARKPPAKKTEVKAAQSKTAHVKASPAKAASTKAAPATTLASRRAAAPAAKPRRPTGRGSAGSGRRKP